MSTKTEPDETQELTLKWELPFRELLDQIYWPGYAERLIEENPDAYQIEYYFFISLYDEPPPT